METEKTNELTASDAVGFADLNFQQQRKCTYFLTLTNNEEFSVKLVQLLDTKGENTYKKAQEKFLLLGHKDDALKQYVKALYDEFALNELYSPAKIIGKVGKVRRGLGMIPYIVRARESAERDFLNLFIVEVVIKDDESSGKKIKQGYIPKFRLKFDYVEPKQEAQP